MRLISLLFLTYSLVDVIGNEVEARTESSEPPLRKDANQDKMGFKLADLETARDISEFVAPEKPPKYFGIDIDGTMYAEGQEEREKNIKTFAQVMEKGYTPFFCTGRSYRSSMSIFGGDLRDNTTYNGYPGVYNNGSSVYDKDGNIVFSGTFQRDFLEAFIAFLEKKGIQNKCIFYTETNDFSIGEFDPKWKAILDNRKIPYPEPKTAQDILNMKVIYLSVDCDQYDLGNFKENVHYLRKISSSGLYNITPGNVNKALGLTKLLEHEGAKVEDLGYIGNAENDIEAMELSNLSFAVANAKDDVKEHAKWVLDKTCNEAGVAKALALVYGLQFP